MQSEPQCARTLVWAPPVSLAATPGIDFSFFSSGYLDVSVRRVPPICLWIQHMVVEVSSTGFPHSETCGSMPVCGSPQLFAAYHVFRRPLVPRHPPRALLCLTVPFSCPAWHYSGFPVPGAFTHPHSAVAAPCGACFYFLGCFVLSRFSQTQDTMNIPCLPALPIHEILIFQYSVFKVQYGSCLLSGYTPQGLSRLSGLKWTRTTDLTLIRRAL